MNRTQRILTVILSVLLLATLITGCGSSDKYVKLVKNGTLQMAPNIKIGKAFDNFFENPKWESFESSDKERVVEFNGNMTYNNKPATSKIQFIIKNDTSFELGAVQINNNTLNTLEGIAVVKKILTSK